MRKETWLVVGLVAATLVTAALFVFFFWGWLLCRPLTDAMVRSYVERAYPRFELTSLDIVRQNMFDVSFDAGPMVFYDYVLESRDTPGFVLRGEYVITSGNPWHVYQDTSIFDGTPLNHRESLGLQRLWVAHFPHEPLYVGDDGVTTQLSPSIVERWGSDTSIAPRYRSIPLAQVFQMDAHDELVPALRHGAFLRLNPATDKWTLLPDFLEVQE